MLTKKITWITMAVLSTAIGLYPSVYLIIDQRFGLLQSKSDAVLSNVFWNIEFYLHISFGGLALLIGWMQFSKKLRLKNLKLHRNIGKVYVFAALISALSSIYIAFYAQGGIIASAGFLCLGIIWFSTTLKAFIEIRNKRILQHQKLMIYSYACCFAAVTLRIYLPLLIILFHDFITAYLIVAWLCWIPNIILAYFLVRRIKTNNRKAAFNLVIANTFQ